VYYSISGNIGQPTQNSQPHNPFYHCKFAAMIVQQHFSFELFITGCGWLHVCIIALGALLVNQKKTRRSGFFVVLRYTVQSLEVDF
jgi:hypothetical protein